MVLGPSTVVQTDASSLTVTHIRSGSQEGVAVHLGNLGRPGTLVRIHSSCLFSEALNTVDCDCRLQLNASLQLIQTEGRGIVVYLYQEGRGQGLANKIRGMDLMHTKGHTTARAYDELCLDRDARDYSLAVSALRDLGVSNRISLISNNPRKGDRLRAAGFVIERPVSLTYPINEICHRYLISKRDELGHQIRLADQRTAVGDLA